MSARRTWFDDVYERAGDEEEAVPWADLAPKEGLSQWLDDHPGNGRKALDVGCGLGDNAEALARAGYRTTAFDASTRAIEWARSRFPQSQVDYRRADLFDPPKGWRGGFDLVHECFTIQSLEGAMRQDAFAAIAALVHAGGRLLVIALTRAEGTQTDGPPWPLTPSELARFDALGFVREEERRFSLPRRGRDAPHVLIAYRAR